MSLTSDPLFIRADIATRMAEAEAHRRAAHDRLPRVRWRLRLPAVRALARRRAPAAGERPWRTATPPTSNS
jgi:hypothetical protein